MKFIHLLLQEDLCYEDGNLVSGRLEALVEHVVPTSEYYPDRAFLFAFLLSSRLFIKPHELLGQVTTAACNFHRDKTKVKYLWILIPRAKITRVKFNIRKCILRMNN